MDPQRRGPWVLERAGLDQLIDRLRQEGYRTLGPTVQGDAVVYDEIESQADLPIGKTDEQEGGTYRLRDRDDDRPRHGLR